MASRVPAAPRARPGVPATWPPPPWKVRSHPALGDRRSRGDPLLLPPRPGLEVVGGRAGPGPEDRSLSLALPWDVSPDALGRRRILGPPSRAWKGPGPAPLSDLYVPEGVEAEAVTNFFISPVSPLGQPSRLGKVFLTTGQSQLQLRNLFFDLPRFSFSLDGKGALCDHIFQVFWLADRKSSFHVFVCEVVCEVMGGGSLAFGATGEGGDFQIIRGDVPLRLYSGIRGGSFNVIVVFKSQWSMGAGKGNLKTDL